jgi:hypothetical protein
MKFLREPLVHFLFLGAALFVLFALVDDSEEGATDRIVVTAAQVESLAEGFASTWQRLPTPDELNGLIENHVREEVYYREAVAMGLDRDDTIIRRRMLQKLEFLTDDMNAAAEPSDEDLRAYFREEIEKFRPSIRVSFDQVFFNREMRGGATVDDATALLAELNGSAEEIDPETLGDGLTLPSTFEGTDLDRIERRFGGALAEDLTAAPIGSWSGPVESGFGLHIVRVREREAPPDPEFEAVRDDVEREWRAARRMEAAEAFFEGLKSRYTVTVETESSP